MANIQKRNQGGALSPVQQLKGLLSSTAYQSKFHEILGERKAQFVSALTSLVSANSQLQKCRPETIIKSAIDAAIMGLPIQPGLGYAYIVPYGQEAQFQIGYKGLIQLALNTGQFERFNAGEVREGELKGIDEFQEAVFDWSAPGGDVIGYWAGFRLGNGYRKMVYMTVEQCKAHAKEFSKAYQYDLKAGKANSPWSKNFGAMATKTCIKRLLHWAPKAIEMIDTTAPKALVDPDEDDIIPVESIHDEAAPVDPSRAEYPPELDDQDILNFGEAE